MSTLMADLLQIPGNDALAVHEIGWGDGDFALTVENGLSFFLDPISFFLDPTQRFFINS